MPALSAVAADDATTNWFSQAHAQAAKTASGEQIPDMSYQKAVNRSQQSIFHRPPVP